MSGDFRQHGGPRLSVLATAVSGALGTTLATEHAAAQEEVLEEVTVTGSRIVRRDFSAPSPIMTVDATRLEQSSTMSIETVLNQMPQFTPAGTQFVSGGQGSSTTTLGIASVNLRGIGTNRTLVLVDGKRPQPANAALVVDLNTIPSAAIARVETITGGASAVYGPDALAGVVNFVLKNDFEGVDFDYQTSMTAEGDGQERRFTTLFGINSADGRSNVMVGLEYYDREVVWQRDREFYQNGWFDPGTNAGGFLQTPGYSFAVAGANRPTQEAVNAIFAPYGVAPPNVTLGTPGVVHEIYFNPDGSPFTLQGARNYRGPIAATEMGDGYAGVRFLPNGNLGQVFMGNMSSTPQERRSMFGRARYDVADNLTAFAQVTFSNNTVTTAGGIPPAITVWQALVPNDGQRVIPDALQTLLDSRPNPGADWALFRGLDFFDGRPLTTDNSNDVYQLMAGLEGRFPNNDWTWELYASTGQTDTRNDYRYLPSLQRYQMLVARPNFGEGRQIIGRNYELDCPTGLPIFGGGANVHPRCLESMDFRGRGSSLLTQDVIEFNLQGKVADLQAGEIRFAAGAAYRDNTFRFEPLNDDINVNDHPIGLFVSNNTYGEMSVREIYGELLVPATSRLNIELGYRYSEFNTAAGNVDTWKALFDYAPVDSVRLRGGFQQATRAPNTAEMFQGPTMLTVGFGPSDPCSYTTSVPWGNADGVFNPSVPANPRRLEIQQLCIDLIGPTAANTPFGDTPGTVAANTFARPGAPFFAAENVIERGNPLVGAETADTWTFGVVLSGVGGLDNLTASIDAYNIEITDAISRIDPVFVYAQCFNADGVSNPTLSINDPGGYCSMIGRNVNTGERDTVQAPFVNQGTLKTAGADIAVNWAMDMTRGGSFYVNSVLSLLDKFELQNSPTEPFLEAKGTLAQGGQFDYRLNTTFGYNFSGGRANVGLRWVHYPSIEDASKMQTPTATQLGVDSFDMFALFAGYQLSDRISIRGGIDNLFDKQPPIVGRNPAAGNNNAASTNTQYYDILGRRAFVGLKMSF
jgi:iron complex outermembrane recepter protein